MQSGRILKTDLSKPDRFYLRISKIFDSYEIGIVGTPELIEEIYRFRYIMYCEKEKLLDKTNYQKGLEFDEYDENSKQIGVYKDSELVGTARIILNSVEFFPTEKEFNFCLTKNIRSSAIEVSRFMLERKHRKSNATLDLIKAVYLFCQENQINYAIGCVEEWFLRRLRMILSTVEVIGQPTFCFNAINIPIIIDIVKCRKFLEENRPGIYSYFHPPVEGFVGFWGKNEDNEKEYY